MTELVQEPSPKGLRCGRQPTALLVGESDPAAFGFQLLSQHAVFSLEVFDDFGLFVVQGRGHGQHDQMEGSE